jgi:hypothetical protein
MPPSGMRRRVGLVRTDLSQEVSPPSVHTRPTRRHIREDHILHSHRRENLKSHNSHNAYTPALKRTRFLSNGTGGSYPRDKAANAWSSHSYLYLVPRLKRAELYIKFPIRFMWGVQSSGWLDLDITLCSFLRKPLAAGTASTHCLLLSLIISQIQ